jgi:hypothetical protein
VIGRLEVEIKNKPFYANKTAFIIIIYLYNISIMHMWFLKKIDLRKMTLRSLVNVYLVKSYVSNQKM